MLLYINFFISRLPFQEKEKEKENKKQSKKEDEKKKKNTSTELLVTTIFEISKILTP